MTLDEHVRHLGGLVANFQSLEFILRAVLQASPSARPIGIPHGTNIYSYPVGAELPLNELTSYDSLGELIAKFNSQAAQLGLPAVDATLVEIRDALAHGRVSADVIENDLRLLKFSKPDDGSVRVTFNERLSSEWFTNQKKRVIRAIELVHKNGPKLR